MSRYRVRLKCWVKVWNNSQPLISWRIFPFFITLETIMVGFELTSFTLGVLMTFFARFANLKVWSVSPWHAAEGDTAASITLRQFPPKQSFKIHVRAYKKKGMKFQLTMVSNHYIGDGQYHFKQTTLAMTAFLFFNYLFIVKGLTLENPSLLFPSGLFKKFPIYSTFKILQCTYTNVLLKKMRILDSDTCTFCNRFKEDIEHLFFNCPLSLSFWRDFEAPSVEHEYKWDY